MKRYVYKLVNPIDGNIFYIGKTRDTKVRFKSHMKHAEDEYYIYPMYVYMRDIIKLGSLPVMEVICLEDVNVIETTETYQIQIHLEKYKLFNKSVKKKITKRFEESAEEHFNAGLSGNYKTFKDYLNYVNKVPNE